MYDLGPELTILDYTTPSPIVRNLASFSLDFKDNIFIAVASTNKVHIFVVDTSLSVLAAESVLVDPEEDCLQVSEVSIVRPSTRIWPYLVVATTKSIQIFDLIFMGMRKLNIVAVLSREKLPKVTAQGDKEMAKQLKGRTNEWFGFYRGITCVDTTIYVGNSLGQILPFYCSTETNVVSKKPLHEHTGPIMDISTCRYDDITASVDGHKELIIWARNMKNHHHKIKLLEYPTCVEILRKHVIVGSVCGLFFLYNLQTAKLKATVDMFKRSITSIHTAPESAYFLVTDEDGFVNVYKLHTRKPSPFQVEHRFSEHFPDRKVFGGQFLTARGNVFSLSLYDDPVVRTFRITPKPSTEPSKNK
ncbi:unnamed protein product [Auanema sp. JU1783]|nr:unnamed protein product [Auanema sp. JU1783]